MKSTAKGQFLGYGIQFPRAVYYLTKCSPGDSIYIEHLGDVAVETSGGNIISEEDKTSITKKPITDMSKDLWKTLFNWVSAAKNGELDPSKSHFVLYTNRNIKSAIANSLHKANTLDEVRLAAKSIKARLKKLTIRNPVWNYFDFVLNKNKDLFEIIIPRFSLEIGNGAGYNEARDELYRQHVSEGHIHHLLDAISGWVQRKILEKISKGFVPSITWEEYHAEFKIKMESARQLELIDFTLIHPPSTSDVQQQVKIRPCYVRQLESIEIESGEIIGSVADYIRAKINRERWIETDTIDADIAKDFEDRLIRNWKNISKQVQITERDRSDIDKGQLILASCKLTKEMIRNMQPPAPTIAGTYHYLADTPNLGWHPEWAKLFQKSNE